MKKSNIGENLKIIRNSLGLSQEEFAKILNVGRTTIGHWENGYSFPSIIMIQKIKEIFNVSYEEIIDGI